MATDPTRMLEGLYRALNQRDADAAMANMGPGVEWPNEETGGTVTGHDALRAYWTALWKKSDVIVEPVRIDPTASGARVRVDRLVRSLDGKVLDHRQFEHVYEFKGPFISRMTSTPLPEEPEDDEEE
jgi:limonene-1,2-epoxide hydrolase